MVFGRKRKVVPFRSAGRTRRDGAACRDRGFGSGGCSRCAKPGVSTLELNAVAESVIRDAGCRALVPRVPRLHRFDLLFGQRPRVHGIPSAQDILAEGDLVSIDCGAILDGWHGTAWTFGVGEISVADQELSEATRLSMEAGIAAMIAATV